MTVDSEQVSRPEDRLLLLRYSPPDTTRWGGSRNRDSTSRAQAFRTRLGEATLYFLLGKDKLLRFRSSLLSDRDGLEHLFAISLIVANRGDMDESISRSYLTAREPSVSCACIFSPYRRRSLTSATALPGLGGWAAHRLSGSAGTVAFLTETRAFAPPLQVEAEKVDMYAARLRLLAQLYAERC